MTLYGTEISFRLGPGTVDEARGVARGLAAAAAGCRRHVLFVDAEAGEYGCLAEWGRREDAEGFAERPATRERIAALAARLGKEPRVRLYAMEETEGAPSPT
jgi:quinol monooxygenase YgiN